MKKRAESKTKQGQRCLAGNRPTQQCGNKGWCLEVIVEGTVSSAKTTMVRNGSSAVRIWGSTNTVSLNMKGKSVDLAEMMVGSKQFEAR